MQSGLNTTCCSGLSALATMTAPATESSSQCVQPCTASTNTSNPLDALRACHPKMLSVLSLTLVSDSRNLSLSTPSPSTPCSTTDTTVSSNANPMMSSTSSTISSLSTAQMLSSSVSRNQTSSARDTLSAPSSPSAAKVSLNISLSAVCTTPPWNFGRSSSPVNSANRDESQLIFPDVTDDRTCSAGDGLCRPSLGFGVKITLPLSTVNVPSPRSGDVLGWS
mmetsp:Transcript_9998/g.42512  ORF Transcript_9998/g.42512 Transcript_9998/m.42512 type:complete len:222 (+) Transcript_9998:98-763(+)